MEPETVAAVSVLLTAVPMSDFSDFSSSCPELCQLRNYITKGWLVSSKVGFLNGGGTAPQGAF